MFDASLISELAAQAPVPPDPSFIDKLSGPWAVAATILAACAYAVAQAFLNHRKPEARAALAQEPPLTPIPTWAMYGPVHEVMQTIHDMAEEERKQTAILEDIVRTLHETDRGHAYMHRLLEAVLRNQEMSPSYQPPTPQETARRSLQNETIRRNSDADHRSRRRDTE